jgi:hypothetical protein
MFRLKIIMGLMSLGVFFSSDIAMANVEPVSNDNIQARCAALMQSVDPAPVAAYRIANGSDRATHKLANTGAERVGLLGKFTHYLNRAAQSHQLDRLIY